MTVLLALTLSVAAAACGTGGSATVDSTDAVATGNPAASETPSPESTGTATPTTVEVAEGWITEVDESVTGDIRIAHGQGMTHSSLLAAKGAQAFEKKFPNANIEWLEIAGTSQQRDAFLAGQIDFGTCSTHPFLSTWDAGVEWRIVEPTGLIEYYFVTTDSGPDSIEEMIGTDAVLSPGPDTAPYYAVQAYLDSIGEDPHALDENWTLMPHPDSVAALETGQITMHATGAEFALNYLQQDDKKVIQTYTDAFSEGIGICTATMQETVDTSPDLVRAFQAVIRESADWGMSNPEPFAQALSDQTQGEVDVDVFLEQLQRDIVSPSHDLGLKSVAESLTNLGVIDRPWSGPADFYAFPEDAPDNW